MMYIEEKLKRIPVLSFLKKSKYVMYVGPNLSTLQLARLRLECGAVELLYLPEIFQQLSDSVIKYNFPGMGMSEALTAESIYDQIIKASGAKMSPDNKYIVRYKDRGYVFFDAGNSISLLESYVANLSYLSVKKERDRVAYHHIPMEFESGLPGGVLYSLSGFIAEERPRPSTVPTRTVSRKKPTKEQAFDAEMEAAVQEAHDVIKGLLLKGCPPELLVALINQNVKLSRLRITKKYKIHLVDYDNMEIKLSPLPKTIFLFFLRHPEGVAFSHLQDHRQELMDIYSCICTNDDPDKMKESIDRLVDPFDNSINEKCALVKKAFLLKITDSVALNYYISGAQGDKKCISLDRSLVEWECNF